MTMTMTIMSFSITFAVALIQLANAANYIVGGTNGGWDTSTDLQTWSSSQSFLVGDNLICKNHNLVQVTKSDFDSCQTSNPIQSHNDGNTLIPLSSPGKIYFICGAIGHCGQGMKLQVDTLPSLSPSPSPKPSSPSPQGSAPNLAQSPQASTPNLAQSPQASTPNLAQSPQASTPNLAQSPQASTPTPNDTLPPPPLSSANTNRDTYQTTLSVGLSIALLVKLSFMS